MDQNEMYETQAGMEDSSERLEKKEQLRAKVQALVTYYEEEKRRNEELTMEVERLKAEQQSITGPLGGPAPGAPGMPPMPGMNPPGAPGMNPGGIPFGQRPQQQEFQPQGPQAPGGYTLQGFGAPQGPQGFPQQQAPQPPRPPQQQAPWQQQGQNPWQQPPFGQQQPPMGQQPGFPQPGFGPGAQQPPFGAMQPGFGPGPQGMGMPGGMPGAMGMPGYPPQAPGYPGAGFSESIGPVLETITQVRSKLHQFESIRGYGYQQQPAYVDYDTVVLLDKLYDQLGDLSRELMQRQGR